MSESFSSTDHDVLAESGIPLAEADRQWNLLCQPPRRLTLAKPCTLDDGILKISNHEQGNLSSVHQRAAEAGRWLKFVPASGAASRMFALNEDDPKRLCAQLQRFAFHEALQTACQDAGDTLSSLLDNRQYETTVDRLLGEPGLGYAMKPKGLLLFHEYNNGTRRTPFEEHLREAARCFRNADGRSQAHFTVSAEHRSQFEALLTGLKPMLAEETGTEVDVSFSTQKSQTDTLAISDDGQPARDSQGRLLLRPGGHGSLLDNLQDLTADLVFVKNIDNVCHERLHDDTQTWITTLGGYLAQLQQDIHRHLQAIDSGDLERAVPAAEQFIAERISEMGGEQTDDAKLRLSRIRGLLNRPIRVCGMVKNEGEPGGGPFWVRHQDGTLSCQIVESAELDPEDDQQQAIFQQSTHFNPVFMALAVRDYQNKPFDLKKFVDNDRFILASKVNEGKSVRVLERPGLWNGSMSDWITLFVEVPKQVFSPVKTVFDLLREQHQPCGDW